MHKYTDALGREWSIEIDPAVARALRDSDLKYDIHDLCDPAGLARLRSDPYLMGDVLSALLSDQIEAAGLDALGFVRGLRGDGADRAMHALIAEVIDYLPLEHRLRLQKTLVAVDRVVAKLNEAADLDIQTGRMEQRIETAIGHAVAEFETAALGLLRPAVGPSSTNAPD